MKRESNGLILKGTYSVHRCIYCGCLLNKNKTKDHVPPRFIYRNYIGTIDENRFTVPCCIRCNQEYSVIEQRLIPFFEKIHEDTADTDVIQSYNNNYDFEHLMTKIAIGYKYIETRKIFSRCYNPKVTYFLKKNVDASKIVEFKRIDNSGIIDDISSNASFPGIIITFDNQIISCAPTDLSSEFWHEYNMNLDYVRMSFYDTLFVQVQF